jgi:hypothetical protein
MEDFESLQIEFQAITEELKLAPPSMDRKPLIQAANRVIERADGLIEQMRRDVAEMKAKSQSLKSS